MCRQIRVLYIDHLNIQNSNLFRVSNLDIRVLTESLYNHPLQEDNQSGPSGPGCLFNQQKGAGYTYYQTGSV